MSTEESPGPSGAGPSGAVVLVVLVAVVVKIIIVIAIVRCCMRSRRRNEVASDPRFLTLTMDQFHASDPRILTLTMDQFLLDMEREKPIRFSSHQLSVATGNFSNFLGSGGFGAVYKGVFSNGVAVAVKILNGSSDKRIEEQFMAEVSTIGRTHHCNLVRLLGFCFERNLRALVYEYMVNGSLDRFLFQDKNSIEFEKLHDIALGTAKGIAYLHEECPQRIIHYDIKPGNILLDANFKPKVADFGLAKLYNRENTVVTMIAGRGTPGYAAPELWMPFGVTYKCDVFSFGMLLFEIIGRRKNLDVNLPESQEWFPKRAWDNFDKGETGELMVLCRIEDKDREMAERILKIALWCIQYRSEWRPCMSLVVKMLEGGVEIARPADPFPHLVMEPPPKMTDFGSWTESGLDSSASQMLSGSPSLNATPVMRKYQIEIASA